MMGIFKQIRLLPCFNRKLTQLFSEPYGFVPISRVWNPLGILPSHLMANRHNQRCWLPVDFRHQTTCLLYIFVIVSAFMRIAAGVHCLSVVLQKVIVIAWVLPKSVSWVQSRRPTWVRPSVNLELPLLRTCTKTLLCLRQLSSWRAGCFL